MRRRDGRYDYLNTSDLFVKFLHDIGIGTVADSERVINDEGQRRHDLFVKTAEACIESGAWEAYPTPAGIGVHAVRMHCVSSQPDADTSAVLVIVE